MFELFDDMSIYVTRGDGLYFDFYANNGGKNYKFKPGDVLQISVAVKKDMSTVVLQKRFPVEDYTEKVRIYLTKRDTRIGGVISKPTDYWYQIRLNPDDETPQSIVAYDEDGPKLFRLFPEAEEINEPDPAPEDIPIVDQELDMTSTRPVGNQAISRAYQELLAGYERTHAAVAKLHVTPEMFGAIGDGVADDTDSLQEMFSSSVKGQTISLHNGKYYLSDVVNITKDINIVTTSGEITGKGLKVIGANVTINGVKFKDIEKNAIVTEGNANLTVDKCCFENIGISDELDETFEGCAIYAGNDCETKVYDSEFIECRGHGAVFCNGGVLDVKNSRFIANYYRAIQLYGANETKGVIFGNHIEDCGKYNETGSGVGCNGIYSTNGIGVVVENNTILNSRENAIEGKFMKVVGNYIDGTGVEIETKPTPSNEGIFISSAPAYVANNVIFNSGSFGIKSFKESAITEPMFIIGNIIRGGGTGSIDINSAESVNNAHIIDNVVDGSVNLNNFNDTDIYIGDISKLNGRPNISNNKAILDYHHYFDIVAPFTYSNCSPTITTDNGESCVEVAYKEYAKLIYALPSLKATKHLLDFTVLGKGRFTVNLTKNNAYYGTILEIDSNEYLEKHYVLAVTGEISDKFKISIEFQETSHIKTVDIQLYR